MHLKLVIVAFLDSLKLIVSFRTIALFCNCAFLWVYHFYDNSLFAQVSHCARLKGECKVHKLLLKASASRALHHCKCVTTSNIDTSMKTNALYLNLYSLPTLHAVLKKKKSCLLSVMKFWCLFVSKKTANNAVKLVRYISLNQYNRYFTPIFCNMNHLISHNWTHGHRHKCLKWGIRSIQCPHSSGF